MPHRQQLRHLPRQKAERVQANGRNRNVLVRTSRRQVIADLVTRVGLSMIGSALCKGQPPGLPREMARDQRHESRKGKKNQKEKPKAVPTSPLETPCRENPVLPILVAGQLLESDLGLT